MKGIASSRKRKKRNVPPPEVTPDDDDEKEDDPPAADAVGRVQELFDRMYEEMTERVFNKMIEVMITDTAIKHQLERFEKYEVSAVACREA